MTQNVPSKDEPTCDLPQELREIVRDYLDCKPVLERLNAYIRKTFEEAKKTLDRKDRSACEKIVNDVRRVINLIEAKLFYRKHSVTLTCSNGGSTLWSFRLRANAKKQTNILTKPYTPIVEVRFPEESVHT